MWFIGIVCPGQSQLQATPQPLQPSNHRLKHLQRLCVCVYTSVYLSSRNSAGIYSAVSCFPAQRRSRERGRLGRRQKGRGGERKVNKRTRKRGKRAEDVKMKWKESKVQIRWWKRGRSTGREEHRSVSSSEKTTINHHRTQLTMKTCTKGDQYSILNSTRNQPITLMAPSMLPISNSEA